MMQNMRKGNALITGAFAGIGATYAGYAKHRGQRSDCAVRCTGKRRGQADLRRGRLFADLGQGRSNAAMLQARVCFSRS